MAEAATAVANKPAWVDLASKDPAAAQAFYAKLFGWDKRKKNGSDPGPMKRGIGVAAARWGALGGRGPDEM